MRGDQVQPQRFERKYFITERQAFHVRQFVTSHLVPDEHSKGRPDFAYPVHSVYLDSDELATYWATVHCEKSRFKLRVRFYDDDPASPVFFEIKRRMNECILKQRGAVHRTAAPVLVAGHLPEPRHLVSAGRPGHLVALQNFCLLMSRLAARPKVHVAYERAAWVSPEGNAVRVTIDRDVRGEIVHHLRLKTRMLKPASPFKDKWILELKFTNRFPDWFRDMVQHLNLIQTGVPKYCGSVADLGEERLGARVEEAASDRLAQIAKYC